MGINWFKKEKKERERYYLLPGQGCQGTWQSKQKWMLAWATMVGLIISTILALVIYLLHYGGHS